MTALWETLEEYLFDREAAGEDFNIHAVAADWGTTAHDAGRYLRSYQDAQRKPESKTLFIVERVPGTRTSNAMWHVGVRARDAAAMGAQLADDVHRRVDIAIEPTLRRIGELNPHARRRADAVASVIAASVELLVSFLDGDGEA